MKSLKDVLKDRVYFSSLPLSIGIFRENLIKISFPLLSDLLLVFIYGFIVTGYIAEVITNEMIRYGFEVSSAKQAYPQGIFFNEATKPILIRISLLILAMILITYILFVIFQSFSFWYCRRISKLREKGFFSYFGEFCKVNAFWFGIFVIYNIISYLDGLLSMSAGPGIFLDIFFLAMVYFALISCSMLPEIKGFANIKRSFSLGIKKIDSLLPAYAIVLFVFFVINMVLTLSLRLGNAIFIFIGVFLLMPALSWMRIYFMAVTKSQFSDKKFNKR